MCWRVEPDQGLVLDDVRFAPAGHEAVPVLASMTMGQLEVPYDTGLRTTEDITTHGFGGRNLRSLTPTECPGTLRSVVVPDFGDVAVGDGAARPVLCEEVVDGGIAYRSEEGGTALVARKDELRLSTVSKVGWYEYVTQYTFGADGSIRPELGATGDLSPDDYTDDPARGWPVGPGGTDRAASHAHNAVWRLHWALGGRGGQVVEQYDAVPTGEHGPRSPVLDGTLARLKTEQVVTKADRRWWRVARPGLRNADGHPVSYQIDLGPTATFELTADHGHEGAGYDVAFSEASGCQVFASANDDVRCGRGVPDFVADAQPLDDVVAWVAVGFHHVPRDEDQSPMEMHWQGFTLTPRDLVAQRADVPPGREAVNGDVQGEPARHR
ncbi:copper amine oxidase [Xylanimonas oleitrophica]|uniref:Amine oxidase n=2 Tax=Xylanimonas oleitrophica TaxID=2607479 RepID=A0A2W5WN70_9MICO|nr:copper amine oxidase [Xylanimonas oleitrophica]